VSKWQSALTAAGVDRALHVHDLRHSGNTLASATGVSLRELMTRMGHASTRAALMYQHATVERDRAIANGLGSLIARELEDRASAAASGDAGERKGHAGGTRGVRKGKRTPDAGEGNRP
jgi:hypothetical protein